MRGSWERYHRQHQLVNAVVDEVARSRSPHVRRRDEVDALFGDLDSFLLAVHRRWWTTFDAYLDAVHEEVPDDLPSAVDELWQRLATRNPGMRMLIDAHLHRPALAAAEHSRRALNPTLV